MRTLFFDLASHNGCIACVSDDKTVAFTAVDRRINDGELMPVLEEMLKKAGWTYQDLTSIACVTGPGGFTSLRSAVTLANVLADQLKIPAAGVHVSDLYAARVNLERDEIRNSEFGMRNSVIWMHSTKKTALFLKALGTDDEPKLMTIDELLTTYPSVPARAGDSLLTRWTGELIPEHRDALKDLQLEEATLRPIEEILPDFLAKRHFEGKPLIPWYGRGW